MIEIIEEGRRRRLDPASVPMIAVASSNVESIGYAAVQKVLFVRFLSGQKYGYRRVDKSVFDAFLGAASKGRFVWQILRNFGRDDRFDYFITNDDGTELMGQNNNYTGSGRDRLFRIVLAGNQQPKAGEFGDDEPF